MPKSEQNTACPAVFLDRDGTINRDVPYCSRPEDFELLPGAGEAIRILNNAGFKVVVITNQSGVARGYFSEETLHCIHEKMKEDLAFFGARIDAIYYCPHHPDDACNCRKPKPGLIIRAARDMNLDIRKSYYIGDSPSDIITGRQAGCTSIRIISGFNHGEETTGNYVCKSLYEASKLIVSSKNT